MSDIDYICKHRFHSPCFQCLLKNGADLDSKNEEEQTPIHLAAKYGRTKYA